MHSNRDGLCLQTLLGMFQECGHGGLEVVMSSFLSWEEAAKVSRPSPPLSVLVPVPVSWRAGLAWCVVKACRQMWK